jgi:hypothetical protein
MMFLPGHLPEEVAFEDLEEGGGNVTLDALHAPAMLDVPAPTMLDMPAPATLDVHGPATLNVPAPTMLDVPATATLDVPAPTTPDVPAPEPELSRTGRRWKRKDMGSLSLCLCGETAQPGDRASIQCQRVGCETVWVSDVSIVFEHSGLNQLSTTLDVLDMKMYVHAPGPVTLACR